MAHFYSMDLSDNVRRGMTQKALNGETQTAPPFGYNLKHKGDIFTVNEEEAKSVRFIFDEFLKGSSKWRIARVLNSIGVKTKKGCNMSTRHIDYILRNITYKGYSHWTPTERAYRDFNNPNTIITKARHEPIIEESVFDMVQMKLTALDRGKLKKERPFETKKHWLSGLIKCANCGSSLNFNNAIPNGQKAHFRCGGYGKGHCTEMNFITVKQAEQLLLDYLYKIFIDVDIGYGINMEVSSSNTDEIEHLSKRLKSLDSKLERAKSAFINGVFELIEYKELKLVLEKEQSQIQKNLAELNQPAPSFGLQKNIQNTYTILVNSAFTKDEKYKAIHSIVDSVVFDKKSGRYQINFYN